MSVNQILYFHIFRFIQILMNRKSLKTCRFLFILLPFFLKAQEPQSRYSIEIGLSRNAVNFFGGNPYEITLDDSDIYNYAVHQFTGLYVRGGFDKKIIKNLSIDATLGYLRSGYQGRHLDSFSFISSVSGLGDLFVRSEKWTNYAVNNLTSSLGLNYSIQKKIILRGGFLFQLPLWVNEKTDEVKLYEFRELNTFNSISNETTGRFKELFTGWELSAKFKIYGKIYLSLGYQQLFNNKMLRPNYDEKDRAPHFKETLFAGLYVINPF